MDYILYQKAAFGLRSLYSYGRQIRVLSYYEFTRGGKSSGVPKLQIQSCVVSELFCKKKKKTILCLKRLKTPLRIIYYRIINYALLHRVASMTGYTNFSHWESQQRTPDMMIL